jgi:tetratricopeptide (TPR) repeat protein
VDAIAYYKRAIAISSDHRSAHGNLGTALISQGRIAEAIAHYERAVALIRATPTRIPTRGSHWRRNRWQYALPPEAMLHVSCEDVIEDLEGQARRLIEFCGLP